MSRQHAFDIERSVREGAEREVQAHRRQLEEKDHEIDSLKAQTAESIVAVRTLQAQVRVCSGVRM